MTGWRNLKAQAVLWLLPGRGRCASGSAVSASVMVPLHRSAGNRPSEQVRRVEWGWHREQADRAPEDSRERGWTAAAALAAEVSLEQERLRARILRAMP